MMLNRPDPALLYRRPMGASWWLRKRGYFLFIVRELTSVFIAAFLVVMMVQIHRLGEGMDRYLDFLTRLSSPEWLVFHGIVLFFAVWHSLTWFYTTSIVMPLKLRGEELPRVLFTALNVAAWLGASAVIIVLYTML